MKSAWRRHAQWFWPILARWRTLVCSLRARASFSGGGRVGGRHIHDSAWQPSLFIGSEQLSLCTKRGDEFTQPWQPPFLGADDQERKEKLRPPCPRVRNFLFLATLDPGGGTTIEVEPPRHTNIHPPSSVTCQPKLESNFKDSSMTFACHKVH